MTSFQLNADWMLLWFTEVSATSFFLFGFYPHDAMLARVLAVIVCLCVCLYVCLSQASIVSKRLNVGSRKQSHVIAQYPLRASQPWEPAKSPISTNRKSITPFPTSHRWTVYVTLSFPKGGTKSDFAVLPVKFNFCRKKSAAKFLCVKTSSDKVVATSFLYLTVHRWIAGDVPIYLKFALIYFS